MPAVRPERANASVRILARLIPARRAPSGLPPWTFRQPSCGPTHTGCTRVVANLLTNAAKSTPTEGQVCLSVHASERSAYLEVTDTGPGVPTEEQDRIFDRFFRGEAGRRAGGTGIGLAVARELVVSHDGEIQIKSPAGGGARFIIRLPLNSDRQPG